MCGAAPPPAPSPYHCFPATTPTAFQPSNQASRSSPPLFQPRL